MAVLHDPSKYANEVRSDEVTAKQLGITGAPFFVIDRKYAISGAQPIEIYPGFRRNRFFKNRRSNESAYVCG
ncbi:DsbA family protein [Paenibacillus sp. P3E]|uniref:DsbA family oxidoreductase n=1 Tax=Paenibacillus sp. P3E TaxID=1349435 RepID=UPI00093AA2F0